MKKLVFATSNENKIREIREILSGMDFEVITMKEAGLDMDIVEDGKTFEENALIKARAQRVRCRQAETADTPADRPGAAKQRSSERRGADELHQAQRGDDLKSLIKKRSLILRPFFYVVWITNP